MGKTSVIVTGLPAIHSYIEFRITIRFPTFSFSHLKKGNNFFLKKKDYHVLSLVISRIGSTSKSP